MAFVPKCALFFLERTIVAARSLKLCSPLPNANCRAALLAAACLRSAANCCWFDPV